MLVVELITKDYSKSLGHEILGVKENPLTVCQWIFVKLLILNFLSFPFYNFVAGIIIGKVYIDDFVCFGQKGSAAGV